MKVKLKLSTYLINHKDVKAYGVVELQLLAFLTAALDECERSATCTSYSALVKRGPGWAAWLVWLLRRGENILALPGVRRQFLSPSSGCLNLVLG
jgi:hypothetical protein